MRNCSSFRENCVTHARTHTRTHAHGANYNLPPASRAGDNYPLLYELQHINLFCLYLPKEDGVSPDAEYITQIIFSIFLQ